jgi:SAM-dependent methyltransferase
VDIRKLHEANRQGWNEGAEAYEVDNEATIEFIRNGGQNFCPPELPYLENLSTWCKRAIHLQCAGGRDTLSLWNRGAHEVIGVDISDRMIGCAQTRSEALNAPATWFRCDLLDTPSELNGTADLVYTGRGALCWIMDLDAWAGVVHRLLKPGGKLYIFEGHPVSDLWTLEDSTYVLDPEYGSYFQDDIVASSGWPETYIGDLGKPESEHAVKHERVWRTDQIINSILNSGLRLLKFEEHPDLYWDRFPNMPDEMVRQTPQTFSLLAVKE